MLNLHGRLREVHESGVYRLNCTIEDLRQAAQDAGFLLFDINLSQAHDQQALLATLADGIDAPEYFGHNWDALVDVLSDLSWHPAPGYVMLLRDVNLNDRDEETLSSILLETNAYWEMQGTPFWVFFA